MDAGFYSEKSENSRYKNSKIKTNIHPIHHAKPQRSQAHIILHACGGRFLHRKKIVSYISTVTMSFGMMNSSNLNNRQKPLGDRSLNHSGNVGGGSGINNDHGNDLNMSSSTEKQSKHHTFSSNSTQSIAYVKKRKDYTPNHRRRTNVPFRSPITLCFERMLGAGAFQPQFL